MKQMVALLLLGACSGGAVDEITFSITSPSDGARFVSGEAVVLSAAVTGVNLAPGEELSWSVGDWSASGNDVSVTDLPVGTLSLTARLPIDGIDYTDSVELVIEPPPEPVDYEGILSLTLELESDFGDFDFDCTHDYLGFTVQPSGSLEGEGACEAINQTYVFSITGQVDGTSVSGEMQVDSADSPMAFEGTVADDGSITSTFDETFANDDGSLRLVGDWVASPIE